MKKYLFLLLLPFLAFASCNDDDDEPYYISIATVDNPDNSANFYLKLDNNKRLRVSETNYGGYKPKTGQRILADYGVLDDNTSGNGYDYSIKLYDAYNILTKGIFNITPETQDSIGNDPIGLRKMWIGSDFLNVRFVYDGYNQVHYISLVKDDSKTYDDGKIHLEFRHNAHNDAPMYRSEGWVSFNLTSLVAVPLADAEPLELVIHVKRLDGSETTHEFTYNYGSASSEENVDREMFNSGKSTSVE